MKQKVHLACGQKWTSRAGISLPDQARVTREIVALGADGVEFRVESPSVSLERIPENEFREWIGQTDARLVRSVELTEQPSPGLELGRRIKLLREMAGLNQQQLADRVGISRSAVAFWETGRSGHGGKHLGAMAQALGVEPEVLLTGMAYKPIQETLTPDESTFLELYRQLDPLTKLQAQKWLERRARARSATLPEG